MKYEVFLSDFDGTLSGAAGTVSEADKKAIAEYRKRGGVFAVVTGRMLTGILPRLKELGLEEGLVCAYQGATIADIKTGKLLKDGAFSHGHALTALRALESVAAHVHCYTVERLYANVRDEALDVYERVLNVKGTVIDSEPLSSYVARERLRIVKTLCMVEPERAAEITKKLEEDLGADYYVTRSADFMIEVMPAGQTKGAAAQFLSEYYQVPKEKIAAIGDQLNDIAMLETVGGKFAVANADEGLKKIACAVPSVEEGGVAKALQIAMGE